MKAKLMLLLMHSVFSANGYHCSSNSDCQIFTGYCCNQSQNVCTPYASLCSSDFPGWAIFLIVFFSSLVVIISVSVLIVCIMFKKQARLMKRRQ